MEDWEERPARTSDAATVLPFLAAVLLLPPVILIFATPAAPWRRAADRDLCLRGLGGG